MSDSAVIGAVIGDYQIKRKLGQGAMGVVYRAWDRNLERDAALKLLPASRADDPEFIDRLYAEARAAAKINHPHVVTTYAVGEDAGYHYIAMEFVPGRTLDAEIKQVGRLGESRALEIAAQVAEGLDAAHRRRIYHRDIKPQNIMIDDYGKAKILDFGIARARRNQMTTDAGMLIGTPAYMSPEQCQGLSADARSDFYSLGVTLYETLTGKFPHEARNAVDLMGAIVSKPPRPIQSVDPNISDPVARLLDKALSRQPIDRFQTGGDMAQALRDAARERSGARPALARAGAGAFRESPSFAGPSYGDSADPAPASRPVSATGLRIKSAPAPSPAAAAEWRPGRRSGFDVGALFKGKGLALLAGVAALAAAPFVMRSFSAGETLRLSGNDSEVFSIAIDSTGKRVASGAEDGSAMMWNLDAAPAPGPLAAFLPPSLKPSAILMESKSGAPVFSVAFAGKADLLALGAGDGTVALWDATTGKKRFEVRVSERPIYAIGITPDAKKILAAGMDPVIHVLSGKDGGRLASLSGHEGLVRALAISRAGDLAASGDTEGMVRIWNLSSGKSTQTIKAEQGNITTLDFSPDGARLASGGWNGATRVWKLAKSTMDFEIKGEGDAIRSVDFSDDGGKLTIAGDGGLLIISDASRGTEFQRIKASAGLTFYAAALAPDAKRLIAGDSSHRVRVWELSTPAQ